MAGRIVRQAARFTTNFRDDEATIFTDLNTNPGTTIAEAAARTTLAVSLITTVYAVLENSQLAVGRSDLVGVARYWTASDWQSAIKNAVVGARTWIDDIANDGEDQGQMAIDLSVDEAVAIALSQFLVNDGSGELE